MARKHKGPNGERFVRVGPDLLGKVDAFAQRVARVTRSKCSRAEATRQLLDAALKHTIGPVVLGDDDGREVELAMFPLASDPIGRFERLETALCALAAVVEDHSKHIDLADLLEVVDVSKHEDAWESVQSFREGVK